jgi:hypothetical protein
MVNWLLNPLLLFPLALVPEPGWQASEPPAPPPGMRARLRIERRVIIRVPRMSAAPGLTSAATAAPLPPIRWTERASTDQCLPVATLAGASITRPDSVDMVLTGGRRMRARLADDCPALGFYSGFYIRPPADGRICARRDVIRSRSGGECRIEGFRALIPSR